MSYLIDFDAPPPIGHAVRTKIRGRSRWCRLIHVEPYTRQDGTPSFILTWADEHGFHYTSGLKGKSLTLAKHSTVA